MNLVSAMHDTRLQLGRRQSSIEERMDREGRYLIEFCNLFLFSFVFLFVDCTPYTPDGPVPRSRTVDVSQDGIGEVRLRFLKRFVSALRFPQIIYTT